MTRLLAIIALAAVVGIAAVGNASAATRCAEDAPCWTWSKMGNHERGITTTHGRHVVVGPCRFARLERADRIDWKRTPRLRGDRWAARSGCGSET